MFSGFFSQAFIYLLAAVLAVPLAKRLGLGSALGYILELSTGFDPRAIFEEGLSEAELRSKLQA